MERRRTTTGAGRVAAAVLAAAGLALATLSAAPAAADPRPTITVDYDCDTGGIAITSSKDISNVVVSVDGVHQKHDDLTGHEYVVDLDSLADLDGLWVKSGNNKSGDGPGYGEYFAFDHDATCDPDADGDGYPASEDCDDTDPAINPGVPDTPNNGVDENCDGADLVVAEGRVRVTLIWDNDDDLDLYVTDPNGDRVTYFNTSVPSGGTLDRDDNVGVCGSDAEVGGVENIVWPTAAPPGTYTVELSQYHNCSTGTPAGYTIEVYVDDALVHTQTGSVDSAGGGNANIVDSFTFTVS